MYCICQTTTKKTREHPIILLSGLRTLAIENPFGPCIEGAAALKVGFRLGYFLRIFKWVRYFRKGKFVNLTRNGSHSTICFQRLLKPCLDHVSHCSRTAVWRRVVERLWKDVLFAGFYRTAIPVPFGAHNPARVRPFQNAQSNKKLNAIHKIYILLNEGRGKMLLMTFVFTCG